MSFDLQQSKSIAAREDEGTVVCLTDEQGEAMTVGDPPRPVTITVAGTYSATYRRATDANRNRLFKRRSATLDGDQVYQQGLELIAACVLAWDGFESAGTPLPMTKANVVAVLDAAPWIRDQVEAAMSDHARFFTPS